jgi:hypothetical protein
MDLWIKIIIAIVIVMIMVIMLRNSANTSPTVPTTPTVSFPEISEGYRNSEREDIDCIIDPTLAKCNVVGGPPYY